MYDALNALAVNERTGKRKRSVSNARTGVYRETQDRYLESLGWHWTPTMQIGSGCQVHLRADELPSGRLIVRLSKHSVAVIDHVIHDTHDCSRRGNRCVYGYWAKEGNMKASEAVIRTSEIKPQGLNKPKAVKGTSGKIFGIIVLSLFLASILYLMLVK